MLMHQPMSEVVVVVVTVGELHICADYGKKLCIRECSNVV